MKSVVVITGASRGLGLCLAERFVREGAIVCGTSATKKYWESARERIPEKNFCLYQVDVTREASVKAFISTVIGKNRRIDVLVNSTGYASRLVRIEEETLPEFQKNLSVNLIGTFLTAKYVIPVMRSQKKGWIVNISSFAGKRAVPRLAAYSAAKFGVVALSQCIAKENPDTKIKCVTVCPGGMNTEMRVRLFGNQDADRQQSPEFVADKIMEIVHGNIEVDSGGDIVIRHGKISAINPVPEA